MEKISIEREAFVLDYAEINKLVALLKYCKHRFIHHPNCGIDRCGAGLSFVEYMLNNLVTTNEER